MTGEARDAVSAYTQVMVVDVSRLSKVPERVDVQRIGSFSNRKDNLTIVGFLAKGIAQSPTGRLSWGTKTRRGTSQYRMEESTIMRMPYMHEKLRLFQSIHVEDIKLIGQTVEIIRCRLSRNMDRISPCERPQNIRQNGRSSSSS